MRESFSYFGNKRAVGSKNEEDENESTDIRVPTLVIHHKKDGCMVTPYELAGALMQNLTQTPKKELLTLSGGDLSVSDPCEASSYHGFLGLDAEVVTAIASWIKAVATPNVKMSEVFQK
jgi:hypothetical protein